MSVLRPTSPYPDRKFATIEQWKAIQSELDMKLPAAPLKDHSAIVQVLVGERASGVSVKVLESGARARGHAARPAHRAARSAAAATRTHRRRAPIMFLPYPRECSAPVSSEPGNSAGRPMDLPQHRDAPHDQDLDERA